MSNSLFEALGLWGRPSERCEGKKGEGDGVGSYAYFPNPLYLTLLPRRPTAGSRRPSETINTKVSGKVNFTFYMLNLFPIRFLVDKVKKTEKLSFVGS